MVLKPKKNKKKNKVCHQDICTIHPLKNPVKA